MQGVNDSEKLLVKVKVRRPVWFIVKGQGQEDLKRTT
jgi:hypothetical protein